MIFVRGKGVSVCKVARTDGDRDQPGRVERGGAWVAAMVSRE